MKKYLNYFLWLAILGAPVIGWASEHAAHEQAASGFNWHLLFGWINFTLLVVGLIYFLRKPVAQYFQARAEAIRVSVAQAKQAYDVAIKENQEIEQRLKGIEKETHEIMQAFKEKSDIQSSKILEQAQAYSSKMKEDVQKIAASELVRAREELKAMTVHLAREMAADMIQKELQADQDNQLTQSYIDKLKKL